MRRTAIRARSLRWLLAIVAATTTARALAEVRVQDIARLQGQRTNKLLGYGLIVGLNGTGDGGKEPDTMRALMAIHRKFHQPVLGPDELKNANNVALVVVEATIPDFGAREGQTLDVIVSAFKAESLKGGQLLTTPLQFALFDENDPATQQILAVAGGRIDIPDVTVPTRGVIRDGCTLEADFFYNFILDGHITLVLDDEHDGPQWAQLVARAINHELRNPAGSTSVQPKGAGQIVLTPDLAEAVDFKNVRVRIPVYELARPTGFISRVLQTHVFMTPQTPARVCINRTTGHVSFTGTVTISPTVLQIPELGTLAVAGGEQAGPAGARAADRKGGGTVEFQELLNTLGKLQLAPEQTVAAIEHLYHTGTLHAQLVYTE
jgi:flagellar P-ring protein precursor FlgI